MYAKSLTQNGINSQYENEINSFYNLLPLILFALSLNLYVPSTVHFPAICTSFYRSYFYYTSCK